MERLQEGISTFDEWVSDQRFNKAMQQYLPLAKTQDGQKKILAAAAGGDTVAADYLFSAYKKIIAAAFWKYYLGPERRYHSKRLEAGADEDFASVAYTMLLGAEGTSPFKTFNASKFTAEADLIKQFGYYYYRYLQNEAVKMIRSEKLGGLSGGVDKGTEVSMVGYEDHFENSEEAASSDSFTDEIDLKETIAAFLKKLKRSDSPVDYEIFKGRLKQKSTTVLASELGMSAQAIRNHLASIAALYKDFVGE
jgi:hypothetical protein